MERSPEFASFAGSREYNNKLEDFTEKRFEEDQEKCKEFLIQANTLIKNETDKEIKFNLKVLKSELETFIAGYTEKGFYFPISFREGVQVDFEDLADLSSLGSADDYDNLIERYEAFSGYVDQVINIMDTAVKKDLTNHQASMDGVLEQCQRHLGNVEETVFYKPFKDLSKQLQLRAKAAIKKSIQPGFSKLITFLKSTYLKATRKDIGVKSISDTFYQACLKFHTDTNLTALDVHNIGLSEVARIEKEMKKILLDQGYTGATLKQLIVKVMQDPVNYYNSKEELLEAVKDIIENKINPRILDMFKSKPKSKLEILEKSASQINSSAATYKTGTADGSRPGRFYVNTHQYRSFPKFSLRALCLHESNPGHHLESSYSLARSEWPKFRTITEDRIYSQTPSRSVNRETLASVLVSQVII